MHDKQGFAEPFGEVQRHSGAGADLRKYDD